MSASFRSSFAAPSGFTFSSAAATKTAAPTARKGAVPAVTAARPRPATKKAARPTGRR